MSELPMEEPEADAAEQRRDIGGSTDDGEQWRGETPLDVDEADAAEQSRAVDLDEDEYR